MILNKSMFIILAFIFVSCGGYKTDVTQKDYKGSLKFTGNTSGITISIDDGTPFSLKPEVELYELNPGKYDIKIFRDDSLIVNRIIIIDKQTTSEIEVP